MPVDISPLMDHPGWKTMTPVQRKQALDLWQDPGTSVSDRAEMRQIMDTWASAAAQEPSGAGRVVRSVGGMLKEVPGVVYGAAAQLGRAASGGPLSQAQPTPPPAPQPQTPQEWEARTLPMQQELEEGANAIPGLMAGPAWGRAGYRAGEALLGRLTPRLAQSPVAQTAANALPAIGEAGGNYLSRQANVAMGAEQPGMVGDIASAAVPLVVRGATSAPVARRLPGSAVTQHEMAAEDIRRGAESLQPGTPAETLYRALGQGQNPAIEINDLRQTSRDLIRQHTARGDATRDTRVLTLAQELENLGTHYGNKVPLNVLYDRMKAVGEMAEEAQSKGGRSAREFSNIYAGFHRALENAVQQQVPGAETLQHAIKASRQEHAVQRLQKIIGQDTGEGRGISTQETTGYTFVRGKHMLNQFERALADDDVFRGSFTADEIGEMRQLFQHATELPKLPVPGSVPAGSMRVGIRASIGGGLGYALGGAEGGAAGASAAVAAPEIIAKALMHPRGRQYLRTALEGRGGMRPETLAVINEAIREVPETYTSKRRGTTSP
jgi:hypothetical protein